MKGYICAQPFGDYKVGDRIEDPNVTLVPGLVIPVMFLDPIPEAAPDAAPAKPKRNR